MRWLHLFLVGFFLCLLGLGWYPGALLQAASDSDTVINECMQRTGLNESLCINFIKKYMNVERCQDYTKLSASECEKKIAALKTDPKFGGSSSAASPNPGTQPSQNIHRDSQVNPLRTDFSRELADKILIAKQEKARQFQSIDDMTQALLHYLEKNGQDIHQLKSGLVEFEKKQQTIFAAYDQYQSLVETSAADHTVLTEAHQHIREAQQVAAEYYRTTLLAPLQVLITSL